ANIAPRTVIAVGQLAIAKFLPTPAPLGERVGKVFPMEQGGVAFELVPLPHPSGRSTWLVRKENQELLDRALAGVGGGAGVGGAGGGGGGGGCSGGSRRGGEGALGLGGEGQARIRV